MWYNINILFVCVANIKRKTLICKYLTNNFEGELKTMTRRTLTKKQKTIIGVVALAVTIAVIILIWSPWKKDDSKDTTTTTATSSSTTATVNDNSVVIQTSSEQQKVEESTTESEWHIEPRLVLYFKTEAGFADAEFTDKVSASVDEAKALKFSDEVARIAEGERQYVEPEVRLYGVPLGAWVSVTCESMVTKAQYVTIGQNDGAYQYYYWQPRLYSASEQGEYTFKLTIKETEGSDAETVIYYKMAV